MKRISYACTLALQLLQQPVEVSSSDIKPHQIEGAKNMNQIKVSGVKKGRI